MHIKRKMVECVRNKYIYIYTYIERKKNGKIKKKERKKNRVSEKKTFHQYTLKNLYPIGKMRGHEVIAGFCKKTE